MSKRMSMILAGFCFTISTLCPSALAQAPHPTPPVDTPPLDTPPGATPTDASAPKALAPDFHLTTMTGGVVDSAQHEGRVVVLIYVVPRQRGSERAIVDASRVVQQLGDHPVELLIVTAGSDHQPYFESFWKSKSIEGTLGFDAERALYAQLGLIAFPSTIVIDREGVMTHRLSTHTSKYLNNLDGYTRHALGLLDDAQLVEHLKAKRPPLDSTKSLAARHRTVARLMREKGYPDAAEKELRLAMDLDPESVDVRLDLADLFILAKRLDEAEEMLDRVQEIDAHHRRVLQLRGILLFRKNKLDEAERFLTEGLTLNPDPARSYYYLGRIHESRGNTTQALRSYREALARLLDEPMD